MESTNQGKTWPLLEISGKVLGKIPVILLYPTLFYVISNAILRCFTLFYAILRYKAVFWRLPPSPPP